jgi:Pentapeptide repeats (8 copies)
MQGADLSFAEMKCSSLIAANLHGANLSGVNLEKANLLGINFQNAELRNAILKFARLNSANLLGADLSLANLSEADLNHAILLGADLSQTKAHNADFSFASLQGANLTFAQLQGSNLHAANLTGTSLYVTLLLGADLTYTKMVGADLTNTQMTGAILDATDLRGTTPSPGWWSGYFIVQDYGYQIEEFSGGKAISGGTVGIPQSSIAVTENPDWEILKPFEEYILNPKLKKDYENHMTWAEQRFNSVKDLPKFKHFPSGLAYQVIVQICRSPDSLCAIKGFRQNYSTLEHRLNAYEGFPQAKVKVSQIPGVKFVIEDIERQLCTLDDCATIRDKIDDLDCTSFKKKTATRKVG